MFKCKQIFTVTTFDTFSYFIFYFFSFSLVLPSSLLLSNFIDLWVAVHTGEQTGVHPTTLLDETGVPPTTPLDDTVVPLITLWIKHGDLLNPLLDEIWVRTWMCMWCVACMKAGLLETSLQQLPFIIVLSRFTWISTWFLQFQFQNNWNISLKVTC